MMNHWKVKSQWFFGILLPLLVFMNDPTTVMAQQQYTARTFNFDDSIWSIATSGDYVFCSGSLYFARQWKLSNPSFKLDYVAGQWATFVATNGSQLYVSNNVSNIYVYNIGSRTIVGNMLINSVIWSMLVDGDFLFSGHEDGSVYRWRLSGTRTKTKLGAHYAAVWAMCKNNGSVFSASEDGYVIRWRSTDGQMLKYFGDGSIYFGAVASVGDFLFAAGDETFKIYGWRLSTGLSIPAIASAHTDFIYSLAGVGDYLFSGAGDFSIKQWRVSTRGFIRSLTGHTGIIWYLTFGGPYLYSAAEDSTVIQWQLPEFFPPELSTKSVAPVKTFLSSTATALTTKTISSSPAAVKKTTTTKAKTKAGTLSPSSTTTATTLHTPTKEQPAVTPLKEYQFSSAVYALAASKDALFAAGKDEIVTQWSINNQSIPKTDYPIDDWVYAMTTTGNSTTTAAGGLFVAVSNIFIVSFEIGSIVSTGEIQISDNLITYALVQTGDYLISGHQNGAVIQWRIDSGEQVRLLAKHESFVSALAVNGDFVFSAGEDAKLIQLSITSGKIIKTLLNSNNAPYYSVCSIGNYVFAAGDPNFGIFQWRLSDGRLLTSFIGHDNWINFLLASDGYLFSASSDYLVKQWQISTGKCVRDFVGHTDIVYTLALNGHYLFSGSEDSTVKQWLIPELKPHMLSISPTATTTSTGSGRNNNGTFVLDLKTGLIIGGVSLIVSISAAVMVYVWRRKHNAKLQKKPVGQSALSLFGSSIQMVPYNNQHQNTVNLGTNSTSTSRSFPVNSTATLDKYASTSRNKMG